MRQPLTKADRLILSGAALYFVWSLVPVWYRFIDGSPHTPFPGIPPLDGWIMATTVSAVSSILALVWIVARVAGMDANLRPRHGLIDLSLAGLGLGCTVLGWVVRPSLYIANWGLWVGLALALAWSYGAFLKFFEPEGQVDVGHARVSPSPGRALGSRWLVGNLVRMEVSLLALLVVLGVIFFALDPSMANVPILGLLPFFGLLVFGSPLILTGVLYLRVLRRVNRRWPSVPPRRLSLYLSPLSTTLLWTTGLISYAGVVRSGQFDALFWTSLSTLVAMTLLNGLVVHLPVDSVPKDKRPARGEPVDLGGREGTLI